MFENLSLQQCSDSDKHNERISINSVTNSQDKLYFMSSNFVDKFADYENFMLQNLRYDILICLECKNRTRNENCYVGREN